MSAVMASRCRRRGRPGSGHRDRQRVIRRIVGGRRRRSGDVVGLLDLEDRVVVVRAARRGNNRDASGPQVQGRFARGWRSACSRASVAWVAALVTLMLTGTLAAEPMFTWLTCRL